MPIKRVTATDAKNNFGGLLEDVAALGRIDVVRHGRVVAVVLSPRALGSMAADTAAEVAAAQPANLWGATHMIPPELAREARVLTRPDEFDED
ncbi:MAG: type II toxin-antitoxin system Phd/YefM family antitoxin [Steroidobacteraceae bacterium]